MLKNWVLLLHGTSEPIDKYDPVSIPRPILNRTATVSIPSKENVLQRGGGSVVPVSPSSAATTVTTTTTVGVVKNVKGKLKNQVGQGNGKSASRTKAQQQQAGNGNNRKGGGKHDKNKEDSSSSSGAKKKLSSMNSGGSSQRKYQGNSNAGGVGKSLQRQKHPKKELQAVNELNRKSEKAYKGGSAATTTTTAAVAEKTIKAPKQVKETTSLRSHYWAPPRSSTTTPRPPPLGDASIITTSPSTASTASQTRLSKLLFQKYDRIQQVFPEFHPYVPPINEAEKKASLFLAVPNPNSKKQSGEGVKSFRENGKIIFFSDPDFFPATTKPVQRINPVTEQQQQQHRNGITYCKG